MAARELVDAEPARRRVRELAAEGWSHGEVGRAIGKPKSWMSRLMHRDPRRGRPLMRISREASDAIMALGPARALRPRQLVDAAPARAICQTLARAGLAMSVASEVSGVNYETMTRLQRGELERVEARTLARLAIARDVLRGMCPRKAGRWREDRPDERGLY